MKNTFTQQSAKVEHIKGKYLIYVALITLIGGAITAYFINKPSSSKASQSVTIKNNTKSPVAHDIQTQNNYYADSDTMKKAAPAVESKLETPIIKVLYREKPELTKVDTTPKQITTINADHALIVTNGQSGGNNTVITPTVDLPKPETALKVDSLNIPVNKMKRKIGANKKRLGNVDVPDTSVTFYRNELTAYYRSQVAMNELIFALGRNDIVDFDVTYPNGMSMIYTGTYKIKYPVIKFSQPGNGIYKIITYTLNPAIDITHDVQILK